MPWPFSRRPPPSLPPPPDSWRRSAVRALIDQVRDADTVLHDVYRAESTGPGAVAIVLAAEALRDAEEALLRFLGAPAPVEPALCPVLPLQRRR